MTLCETTVDSLVAVALPPSALQTACDPIAIELERPADEAAREALLDAAFGPARFRKTCQKLRLGRLAADGLSLVARIRDGDEAGRLVGTVRLWHVSAGGVPALMLGPLAVDSRYRRFGIGARLMDEALTRAAALGHKAVLLVGDAPYYQRFGFARRLTLGLRMPGPVEDERFLGRELVAGALDAATGLVTPTGAVALRRPRKGASSLSRRRAA
jgi:predicted N-acetyltransferase YhbS